MENINYTKKIISELLSDADYEASNADALREFQRLHYNIVSYGDFVMLGACFMRAYGGLVWHKPVLAHKLANARDNCWRGHDLSGYELHIWQLKQLASCHASLVALVATQVKPVTDVTIRHVARATLSYLYLVYRDSYADMKSVCGAMVADYVKGILNRQVRAYQKSNQSK